MEAAEHRFTLLAEAIDQYDGWAKTGLLWRAINGYTTALRELASEQNSELYNEDVVIACRIEVINARAHLSEVMKEVT